MSYGSDIYGVNSYSSNINTVSNLKRIYLGCEPNFGFEANGIFDELVIYAEDKTDVQVSAIFNSNTPATWTDTTIFNANLNKALQGGNLFADGINVVYWNIYKKRSDDVDYSLLYSIDNNDDGGLTEVSDFEVTNYTDYEYVLEGVAEDETVTSKFESFGNRINFQGIYLIDNTQGLQFHFRYNVPEISFNNKNDRSLSETFSRFPIVRRSAVNYKTGTLQSDIISNETNILNQIRILESFEGSNDLVLKIDNGDIFNVDIYNISYTRHPETDEISTIKCDYVQVGEVVSND